MLGCFFQSGHGSSYFIDGVQVPLRKGASYNNLSEFDWTLGYQRVTENLNQARIDFDGAHWIGGASLVLAKSDTESLVKLQEYACCEQDSQGSWMAKIVYMAPEEATTLEKFSLVTHNGQ